MDTKLFFVWMGLHLMTMTLSSLPKVTLDPHKLERATNMLDTKWFNGDKGYPVYVYIILHICI